MNAKEIFDKNEYIFSDFDGTISKKDVIHSFITSFSKGDWTISERLWSEGKISTKDCLKTQFDLILGLKKSVFEDFINSVEIDEYFVDFYKMAKSKNKKIIILSDGFDVFIKPTLKRFKMADMPVFSNVMHLVEKDGFLTFEMEYPHLSKNCLIGAGTCKCKAAERFAKSFTYIGDGLSDRCIAKKASLLFAKKGLENFCKKENLSYFGYKNFNDILELTSCGKLSYGQTVN